MIVVGRGLAVGLALVLASGAAAGDHPRKAKGRRAPRATPMVESERWTLSLPVERKPPGSEAPAPDRMPTDKTLHIGTVTITPGGFLSIDSTRGRD